MTADHIDRTAEVIFNATDAHMRAVVPDDCDAFWASAEWVRDAARALDAAGRLVTPEHDRVVAAKTLRDAADEVYGDVQASAQHWHPLSAISWLRERADRIEAGESDAHA